MQASARDQLARVLDRILRSSAQRSQRLDTSRSCSDWGTNIVRERMLCNARDQLRFLLEDLIPAQIARDGKFVLVLPWNSSLWESPIAKALVENEAVPLVRVCQDTS